ncbi:hypothetical protein ACKKBF_B33995 [Auxenochlorella protothecoides x Auxenochlorella symbiontica]
MSEGCASLPSGPLGGASPPPVMLIMIGIQGSGKSTFAESLITGSRLKWARVNQDSIAGPGKAGTRHQCVDAARKALQAGTSVIVDRCNPNPKQREDFCRLARELGVQVHCVVLDLPHNTCVERVLRRTAHEGGFQGVEHAKRGAGLAKGEGAAEGLPLGEGERPEALSPGLDLPGQWVLDASGCASGVGAMHRLLTAAGPPGPKEGMRSVITCRNPAEAAVALSVWKGWDGRADPGAEWLARRPPVRGSPGSIHRFMQTPRGGEAAGGALPCRAPRTQAAAPGQGGRAVPPLAQRSGGLVHSPTLPPSGSGTATQNPAPGAPGGGGDGESRPESGGPARSATPRGNALALLMEASRKERRASAQDAGARGVAREGGVQILVATPPRPSAEGEAPGTPAPVPGPAGGDSQPPADCGFEFSAFSRSAAGRALVSAARDPTGATGMDVIFHDELCVGVLDKYPKARAHALVLAREPDLLSVHDLRQRHVSLLRHMLERARGWSAARAAEDPSLPAFRCGFHALPSMPQLHLHVISQDFDSPCLKTKQHYNSFTTPFFLDAERWVIPRLQAGGRLSAQDLRGAAEHIRRPLACHRCGQGLANMPKVKDHLHACRAALA